MAKHRNPLPTSEEKAQRRKTARLEKINKIVVIFGAFLVAVAGFFTYSYFFGNPFSKMTAENNIKTHIEINYPSLDLDISAVKYDRETGAFYAAASSPNSQDTHFWIYAKGAEVWDYYEDSVKDLFNTIDRVELAFSETAKSALVKSGVFDEKSEISVAVLDFINARESGEFSLDMPVSTDIGCDFALYVTAQKTASVESLAQTLAEIKSALPSAELPNITLVSVTLKEGTKTASAQNVPLEDIDEGLVSTLTHALENPPSLFDGAENKAPLRVSVN